MIVRVLSTALLMTLLLSALVHGAEPVPKPVVPTDVPRIIIPPDELVPLKVIRMVEAAGPDWGVKALKAPEAWQVTKGKGVRVAVHDTGIDFNHPDLKNRIKSALDMKDFSGSPFGVVDKQGHGSHVAGSVLADGPLPGVAPEAELIVAKVLGDNGSGGVDDIAAGIRWSITRNADVISMSLGGAGQDSFIPPALAEAEAAGVIVIAAAGNDGPGEGTVGFPGGYSKAIAIAAVDVNLKVANFSSRGPAVYVAGPGVQIRSTYPGGQYATMSGTSMATPNIAGIAALWIAAHPEVAKKDRPAKFREALKLVSFDIDPAGRDTRTGWGFPDAVKLVAGGGTIPIPPIPPVPSPRTILLNWSSLTAVAQAELKAAGVESLKVELVIKP